MQNIQESAASTCIKKFDSSQIALSKQFFFTVEQLKLEEEPMFTKQDFEHDLRKVCQRVKK